MNRLYKRTRILMGSPFEVAAFGKESLCAAAIDAAFQEVVRIEKLFTIYQSDRPLARFNLSKKRWTRLDGEILQLLSEAIRVAEKSGGAFDPTAGKLIDLWGFGPGLERTTPPTRDAVSLALKSVGFRFLRVDANKGQVERLKDHLKINLGGIAKGYAIDRAVAVLRSHKVERALVSCGSTLFGFGRPAWQIMIQHPREKTKGIETVSISNQALATSGDYERCFEDKGRRYSHLIDPRSGCPVSGMASVSVLAPTAAAADALSTAAFILGKEEGFRFLEKTPGVAGLIIPELSGGDIECHRTKAWEKHSVSLNIGRRHFLAMICVGIAGLFLPLNADARTVRYATEKEVLLRSLPEAKKFVVEKVAMSPDQLRQAQELAGKGFRKKNYLFLVGQNNEKTVGYGIVLNVVGKKRPITFMIVIEPDGKIRAIEVLLYRESKGFQIRHARFMKQFHQKTKEDPLRLGQDIRSISGATLSSRAAAYAVRKALAIFEVAVKQGK